MTAELTVGCHHQRKSESDTHHTKLQVARGTGSFPSTEMSLGSAPVGVTRDCVYGFPQEGQKIELQQNSGGQ